MTKMINQVSLKRDKDNDNNNWYKEKDPPVDWEIDFPDDFDDDVSIETSNTDLINQLVSFQQKKMILHICFNLTLIVNVEDEINMSACIIAPADNKAIEVNNFYQVCGKSIKEMNVNFDKLQERVAFLYEWVHSIVDPMYLYILQMKLLRYFVMKWNMVWFLTLSCLKRRSFLKQLCSRFLSPKAQSSILE